MLAGTVYFYDEEMEVTEYEDLDEDAFMQLIDDLNVYKVTLGACYHNHQNEQISLLYEKNKKQT